MMRIEHNLIRPGDYLLATPKNSDWPTWLVRAYSLAEGKVLINGGYIVNDGARNYGIVVERFTNSPTHLNLPHWEFDLLDKEEAECLIAMDALA